MLLDSLLYDSLARAGVSLAHSATLHVLCLIRSKLHDLKRQRKERMGELLQVGRVSRCTRHSDVSCNVFASR